MHSSECSVDAVVVVVGLLMRNTAEVLLLDIIYIFLRIFIFILLYLWFLYHFSLFVSSMYFFGVLLLRNHFIGGWITTSNITAVVEPNKRSLVVVCHGLNMQLTENVVSTHTVNVLCKYEMFVKEGNFLLFITYVLCV